MVVWLLICVGWALTGLTLFAMVLHYPFCLTPTRFTDVSGNYTEDNGDTWYTPSGVMVDKSHS